MKAGYEAATNTEKGSGRFQRIKDCVQGHSRSELAKMFHESTAALMHAVDKLINQLRDRTEGTVVKLNDKLTDVFSVCWEQGRTSLDPA